MAINDLKAKQGNADVTGIIIEVSTPREFNKFGKSGRVANAVLKDETGQIKLSLWNEQIDQVKAGDKVHIINGYVNEWQGELQLTTGKFGSLEVLGKSSDAKVAAVTEDEMTEKDTLEGSKDKRKHVLTDDEKTEEEDLEELGEENLDVDEEEIG
ncbi:hypothetical protein COV19_03615 [Candidatus Woesearchaeota archaeon CG10_big_fil_rev_8_21_14_0_10_44_13]|nr:MAG: hypothetical protein COV19_03615 [Candidatus Woesearchaeota archaeon CG10_big_fil_rev_8_21_14_0_10_44_13]